MERHCLKLEAGGLALYFHWSLLLILLSSLFHQPFSPAAAALSVGCSTGIIIMHELGHFLAARLQGLRVSAIVVHFMGGYCEHEEARTSLGESLIAWGGVAAQFALMALSGAIILILTLLRVPISGNTAFALVSMLTIYNLGLALFNLVPFPGFDGEKAWKIFSRTDHAAWPGKEKPSRKRETSREKARAAARLIMEQARDRAFPGDDGPKSIH